ncbi:MAG TPA: hypothetical protein VF806_04325 [Anaerolineaceae bacterium]
MDSIVQAIPLHPQWMQPKMFENRYELRSGDQVFATLMFPKAFGSLAMAATSDGQWTFKRVGFFNIRMSIRVEGQETDLAIYHPRWTGTQGTLNFTGGVSYVWKVANFWATEFVWEDASGNNLMTFRPGVEDANLDDLFKIQARVEFQPDSSRIKDISLLAVFGWYLMILKQQDDAGAVAATTAAVG